MVALLQVILAQVNTLNGPRGIVLPPNINQILQEKRKAMAKHRPLPKIPAKKPKPPAGVKVIDGSSMVIPGSRAGFPRLPNSGRPVLPSRRPSLSVSRPVDAVIQEAVQKVKAEDKLMMTRLNNGIDMVAEKAPFIEPLLFSESPLDATHISTHSRIINWIARLIKGTRTTLAQALAHPEAARHGVTCPYHRPVCNASAKYRTFDGTCNNLDKPLLGSAFTPFLREAPAEFATDRITKRDDLPKISGVSGALHNPRDISRVVHQAPASHNEESIWSMKFSLFGQFLTHDLADKAPIKGKNGSMLHCCDQTHPTPDSVCININTKPGDIFHKQNRHCLGLSRSLEVTDLGCQKGSREVLNMASSYLDGSAIYGISEDRARHLRSGSNGQLAVSEPNELPIMPHANVQATLHGFAYFGSGDDRGNVYAGLIAIETVWMREHNRIASRLAATNPLWNDEKIFQETRRIIVAMLQHISYTDYLEGIVGEKNLVAFGLKPQTSGYFTGYNKGADPSLSNAFASSAMRFGHSMIRDSFSKRDRNYVPDGTPALNLKDIFFQSSLFLKSEDELMRGFVADASTKCDRIMSDSLVNHLHQTTEGNGGDLAAINVQRNQEHGIPSYNTYRKLYALSVATRFDTTDSGFKDQHIETVNLFRQVYNHVDDVELWSAGLSEKPETPDVAVGPLFAKMIARQFRELKQGDRFWYETNDPLLRFTPAQLNEIRKIRFSKILCNTMLFDTIQPNPFLVDNVTGNARVPCSSLEDIDLTGVKTGPKPELRPFVVHLLVRGQLCSALQGMVL